MDNEKIRQFQRRDVSWPGVFRVAECDREQLQFASSLANSRDDFSISVKIVDIGFGGMGVESPAFLPRNLSGTIEVTHPNANAEGATSSDLLLTHEVTARRCRQISREPAYLVGLGFGSTTPEFTQILEELMADSGVLRSATSDQLNQERSELAPGGTHHA